MKLGTGIILAAGRGSRLLQLTRATPKELLPIGGRPIIDYCIEVMRESGMERLIIVVGYHKKAIIDFVGSGSRYGIDVAYVFQEEQKGTGNALLCAESFVSEDFSLMFGDDYIEPVSSLRTLAEAYFRNKSDAAVGVSKVEDARSTSIVKVEEGGKILDIVEKPKEMELWGNLGSNGTFILNKKIFDYLRRTPIGLDNEIYLSDAIGIMVNENMNVHAIENSSYYRDIGIMDRYLSANKRFFKGQK